MTPRVLVVEDEQDLARLLVRLLEGEGYVVDAVHDGQAGPAPSAHPAGTTSCCSTAGCRGSTGSTCSRRLRRSGVTAPALMLTAYDTVPDRVEGLDSGAQDYLGKPFDVDELLARLRSLVRRTGARRRRRAARPRRPAARRRVRGWWWAAARTCSSPSARPRCCAPWPAARRASSPGTSCGTASSSDAETDAVVETYVSYLRRKLGADAVRTVRGVGYRMGTV